ncbi:hypothetical protein KR009_011781 [Drosophila setifemur]|nr:hypothetical protein KR009_011781 [Drosophila setifemur]
MEHDKIPQMEKEDDDDGRGLEIELISLMSSEEEVPMQSGTESDIEQCSEEEADDNAFAMDEASLLDVMEPCDQLSNNVQYTGENEARTKNEEHQRRLENIMKLCQHIRLRLVGISTQLQRKTEALDQHILARQREQECREKDNRREL